MGWTSTVRSHEVANRRAVREEQRRQRELQQRAREAAKLSALERARLEVESHENQLEVLLSVHKSQGPEWNWQEILNAPPPLRPERAHHHEEAVLAERARWKPGFLDKLLGRARRQEAEFEARILQARARDAAEFEAALAAHERDMAAWEDERTLAGKVIAGDAEAYSRVLREFTPATELTELGTSLTFRVHAPSLVEVLLKVKADHAVPSEIKSLTATGKLSVRPMPRSRFHEIYQDHVCACVLRAGREVMALLPVETVLVTALTDLFDSRTGRTAEQPILSVALTRGVMKRLRFDRLDPSDAMENFLHRGDFKASRRSSAFVPITPLTVADLSLRDDSAPPEPSAAPRSVTEPSVNPFPTRWAQALRANEIESGFLRLTAGELAALLGRESRRRYSLAESRAIARAVEGFGYCVEPDARHVPAGYTGDQEVGVFQPPGGRVTRPSESYAGAAALFQLCLVVAAADDTVDRRELEPFRRFIETHFRFTPDEHQRLVVMETLLARDPSRARKALDRALSRIPAGKQIVIAQFLVDVAASDGVITEAEHRTLTRIFTGFGLSHDSLDGLLRTSMPARRPTTGAPAPDASRSPGPRADAGFRLDMGRVAEITAETHEVIDLLARAMAEEEAHASPPAGSPEPALTVPRSVEMASAAEASAPAAEPEVDPHPSPSRLEGLDRRFHPVVLRLIGKAEWSRAEFDQLAREFRMLPHGLMDAVNEWSDERLGDFLLEDGEVISVHRHLLAS